MKRYDIFLMPNGGPGYNKIVADSSVGRLILLCSGTFAQVKGKKNTVVLC